MREIGAWDPYNVTEDADVGFRLAAAGYRLGVIQRPTWETAPTTWGQWFPQRARWIKGHMQTCKRLFHTRRGSESPAVLDRFSPMVALG